LDSFLKLDGISDRGRLNEATLKIDEAFLKLSSASTDDFLKLEQNPFIKLQFDAIGDSFVKLGDDFLKISAAGEAVDQFVLKIVGNPVGAPSDANGGDSSGPQADFVVLDHKLSATSSDLKILGADFLKLDTSPNADSFQQKVNIVSDDFLKLSADLAADRVAFLKLSADFLKLSQGGGDRPSPLDLAYKEIGGELQDVGNTFDLLATDFANAGQAVAQGGGGGAGRTPNVAPNGGGADSIGAALSLIYQDFHILDHKLEALGDGSVRVLSELLPAVQHGLGTNQHGGGGGSG
jgi:hypothetical protein